MAELRDCGIMASVESMGCSVASAGCKISPANSTPVRTDWDGWRLSPLYKTLTDLVEDPDVAELAVWVNAELVRVQEMVRYECYAEVLGVIQDMRRQLDGWK